MKLECTIQKMYFVNGGLAIKLTFTDGCNELISQTVIQSNFPLNEYEIMIDSLFSEMKKRVINSKEDVKKRVDLVYNKYEMPATVGKK